jgi:hypothetical protein
LTRRAEYLPGLLENRGVGGVAALIGERDADDWPALACALLLDCPVWTEDADFFGTGVATWTTSRVKLYLSPDEPHADQKVEE